MSSDVLFELGLEELPSGVVWLMADTLAAQLSALFEQAGLSFGDVRAFATPRRLAVWVRQVSDSQPDQIISKRGPSVAASFDKAGHPTPALLGFAKSCGVSLEALHQVKTDKGAWWFYESAQPGLSLKELLPDMILQALKALPVPRAMRWGNTEDPFVRPVHWAVLLHGRQPLQMQVLGVDTGAYSMGHRFHHPEPVLIPAPADYETQLEQAFVLPDFHKRRSHIVSQIDKLAKSQGLLAVMPEALLDEVTSIVEWPCALLAKFDAVFLKLPEAVLIAAMQSHQKSFALKNAKGALEPYFITVSNIESRDPQQVILGNEKVMRARLSDAAFFYQQDQRQPLSDYESTTKAVVFQKGLGSLYDKALRMKALMQDILTPRLQLAESQACRAAELSKCDLMTGMVGEFPELQGLMGYYYAKNDGEEDAVAQALYEQYLPRFAADKLPESELGRALSLADRLDTLVGVFGLGQTPTGMKDPFKLRRHALAVVRLLIEIKAPLMLSTLIDEALRCYGDQLPKASVVKSQLQSFMLDRLQSFYVSQGVSVELIHAARERQEDWLYDLDKRIQALVAFVETPHALHLSAVCKRVKNILQQASESLGMSGVDSKLFKEDAEQALFESIQTLQDKMAPLYAARDYRTVLELLAGLRVPVDAFFEQVMVMTDDKALQNNRLNLLASLQALLQEVADISCLSMAS